MTLSVLTSKKARLRCMKPQPGRDEEYVKKRMFVTSRLASIKERLGQDEAVRVMGMYFPDCQRIDSFLTRMSVLVAIYVCCDAAGDREAAVRTQTIVDIAGVSKTTVGKQLAKLEEGGLVEKTRCFRQRDGLGKVGLVSCYRVTDLGEGFARGFRNVVAKDAGEGIGEFAGIERQAV